MQGRAQRPQPLPQVLLLHPGPVRLLLWLLLPPPPVGLVWGWAPVRARSLAQWLTRAAWRWAWAVAAPSWLLLAALLCLRLVGCLMCRSLALVRALVVAGGAAGAGRRALLWAVVAWPAAAPSC